MKSEQVKVNLPVAVLEEMKIIAKLSGLSVESVLRLALATQVRGWQRQWDVQPNAGNKPTRPGELAHPNPDAGSA